MQIWDKMWYNYVEMSINGRVYKIISKNKDNTKHHLKYRNHFGIFCTVIHTAFSKGDSLSVDQYSSVQNLLENLLPILKGV